MRIGYIENGINATTGKFMVIFLDCEFMVRENTFDANSFRCFKKIQHRTDGTTVREEKLIN